MDKIYQETYKGALLKELRNKKDISINQLSDLTRFGSTSISKFENGTSIIPDDEFNTLLGYFDLDINYYESLNGKEIYQEVDTFIQAIIYIKDDEAENSYQKLSQSLPKNASSITGLTYALCTLIYNQYFLYNTDKIYLALLMQYSGLFSEPFKVICDLYIGSYYLSLNKPDLAKPYIITHADYANHDHAYSQMVNCYIQKYYKGIGDYINSNKYLAESRSNFNSWNNLNRLINVNIALATNEHIHGNYSQSININKRSLNLIVGINLPYEKATMHYNIAFAYIILKDFDQALFHLEEIPKNLYRDNYFTLHIYVLIRLNKIDEAKELCQEAKSHINDKSDIGKLEILERYLGTMSYKQLAKDLTNYYKNYEGKMNITSKEYSLHQIIWAYEQAGRSNKVIEYLNVLYQLRVY